MTDDDFRPYDVLNDAFHYWWVIVVCMLFGATAGWVISRIKQPVYEAQVTFTVSIDYVHTGRMTDIEEDHLIGVVGTVIQSSEVLNEVVDQAKAEGIDVNTKILLESTSTERQFFIWLLRVRNKDAKTAKRLVELWGYIANETLQVGLSHALSVDELGHSLDLLESCLQGVAVEPTSVFCNMDHLADIQKMIQLTRHLAEQEKIESLGLNKGIIITKTQNPTVSSQPVLYGQNLLIFCGGIIGFIGAVGSIRVWGKRYAPKPIL